MFQTAKFSLLLSAFIFATASALPAQSQNFDTSEFQVPATEGGFSDNMSVPIAEAAQGGSPSTNNFEQQFFTKLQQGASNALLAPNTVFGNKEEKGYRSFTSGDRTYGFPLTQRTLYKSVDASKTNNTPSTSNAPGSARGVTNTWLGPTATSSVDINIIHKDQWRTFRIPNSRNTFYSDY